MTTTCEKITASAQLEDDRPVGLIQALWLLAITAIITPIVYFKLILFTVTEEFFSVQAKDPFGENIFLWACISVAVISGVIGMLLFARAKRNTALVVLGAGVVLSLLFIPRAGEPPQLTQTQLEENFHSYITKNYYNAANSDEVLQQIQDGATTVQFKSSTGNASSPFIVTWSPDHTAFHLDYATS